MKECFKCRRSLPLSEFYRHPRMADGTLGKCKDCAKKDVRERYALARADRSKYERERNLQPGRRAKKAEYHRRHNERNPEKAKARNAVGNAVKTGKLARLPCEVCGSAKSQAHHHDYSRPFDVRWMCFACHRTHAHGQVVTCSA